jgi:ribosomal protein S24E
MEWKVLKDFDNRLLKRRELILHVDYGGGATPSKAELQLLVAKKFAVDPARVEISKIFSDKGSASGRVWVKIWDEPKVEVLAKPAEAEQSSQPDAEQAAEGSETEKSEAESSQE